MRVTWLEGSRRRRMGRKSPDTVRVSRLNAALVPTLMMLGGCVSSRPESSAWVPRAATGPLHLSPSLYANVIENTRLKKRFGIQDETPAQGCIPEHVARLSGAVMFFSYNFRGAQGSQGSWHGRHSDEPFQAHVGAIAQDLALVKSDCHQKVYAWNGQVMQLSAQGSFTPETLRMRFTARTPTSHKEPSCLSEASRILRDLKLPWVDALLARHGQTFSGTPNGSGLSDPFGAAMYLDCPVRRPSLRVPQLERASAEENRGHAQQARLVRSLGVMLHELTHEMSVGECLWVAHARRMLCFDDSSAFPPRALGVPFTRWARMETRAALQDTRGYVEGHHASGISLFDELNAYAVSTFVENALLVRSGTPLKDESVERSAAATPLLVPVLIYAATYLVEFQRRSPEAFAAQFSENAINREAVGLLFQSAEDALGGRQRVLRTHSRWEPTAAEVELLLHYQSALRPVLAETFAFPKSL